MNTRYTLSAPTTQQTGDRADAPPDLSLESPVRRVLLLTPRLHDTAGGRSAAELALHLDRDRFEPVVCCYDGWGPLAQELERAGIEIFPLRRRQGLDLLFPLVLALEMRRREIDVVHCLNARKAYVIGALAGVLARSRVAAATFRELPPNTAPTLFAMLGRMCGEIVHHVVATSPEVDAWLESNRWVPPGKSRIVPDGVNPKRFNDASLGAPFRANYGIEAGAPLIGAVVSSIEDVRLPFLAQVLKEVQRERPDARMVVAGFQGRRLSIQGAGRWGDTPALYAACDVLTIPLAGGAVPLTLLESLCARVPVAAEWTGPALTNGSTPEGPWAFAHLADPGPDALARQVLHILANPAEAQALSVKGRERVEEQHQIADHARRVQTLYASTT